MDCLKLLTCSRTRGQIKKNICNVFAHDTRTRPLRSACGVCLKLKYLLPVSAGGGDVEDHSFNCYFFKTEARSAIYDNTRQRDARITQNALHVELLQSPGLFHIKPVWNTMRRPLNLCNSCCITYKCENSVEYCIFNCLNTRRFSLNACVSQMVR